MERRIAVKRALDIIIHLQARLRMDVGGRPAQVLSEFYASIFAQILQASQSPRRRSSAMQSTVSAMCVTHGVRRPGIRRAMRHCLGLPSRWLRGNRLLLANPTWTQQSQRTGRHDLAVTRWTGSWPIERPPGAFHPVTVSSSSIAVSGKVRRSSRREPAVRRACQLHDSAAVEHGDLVGIAHCRDAVRDENGGRGGSESAQSAQDAFFGVGVHAGQCINPESKSPAGAARPAQSPSAVSAAGKGDAALADHGFKALRELFELAANVGRFRRFDQILRGRVGRTKGQVFADGRAEKKSLLGTMPMLCLSTASG